MKISLNEIKKLVPEAAKVETAELVRLIGSRLVEVEGTEDWGEKYRGVRIVRVIECEAIPDTHLHLCQIDVGDFQGDFARGDSEVSRGGLAQGDSGVLRGDFARNEAGLVQVVCGAPNVRNGMLAAWVMPGTKLPADPSFELGIRKLRGYESSGMLAAEDELGLGSDHDGILEIAEGFAEAGDSFAEAFELDDIILDIENKSLTHRPDCFGLVGFAREVAGILGVKFKEPEVKFGKLKVSADNAGLMEEFLEAIGGGDSASEQTSDGAREKDSRDAGERAAVEVKIADAKLCAAYSAMVFEIDAEVMNKKSQYFTKDAAFLAKAGMRSIDPIVDATNIVMLLTGQPLHAFDYDKFVRAGLEAGAGDSGSGGSVAAGLKGGSSGSGSSAASGAASGGSTAKTRDAAKSDSVSGGFSGARIGVRAAKAGEKLELLDGKKVILNEDDIVITSGETAVALAGAMGGKATEIDVNTKRVILESATFSLYNLRKTQMAHGIFSEAITRFTKGQPASGTIPAGLSAAARLISGPEKIEAFAFDSEGDSRRSVSGRDSASGRGSEREAKNDAEAALAGAAKTTAIALSLEEINSLLGTNYDFKTVRRTLENVGFKVSSASDAGAKGEGGAKGARDASDAKDETFSVVAPAWRMDIRIREDVIEEVGRLLGFDNIEPTLPLRPFKGPGQPKLWKLKNQLRNILSDKLRANEVLSYSFVSKDLQEKVGENPEESYEIVNSISPELQVFRQSITPSLLVKTHDNLKAGFSDFALYEFNQVASKKFGLNEEKVPAMREHLAGVVLGDYYAAKAFVVAMLKELGISDCRFSSGDFPAYFEPKHAAAIDELGFVGEIRGAVLRALKIERTVSAFEIDLELLAESMPTSVKKNLRFSKFPSVSRDLTVKVENDLAFQVVEETIARVLENNNLIYKVRPLSIYRDEKAPETKNLSFRLSFASETATLTAKEISDIMNEVNSAVVRKFSAKIV